MIIPAIAFDLKQIAAREALSALPNAPVVAEPVRREAKIVPAVRLQLTVALRRIADALEPAPIEPATR